MTDIWIVSEKNHGYDGPEISMLFFSTKELAEEYRNNHKYYDYYVRSRRRRYFDLESITLDNEDWVTKYV